MCVREKEKWKERCKASEGGGRDKSEKGESCLVDRALKGVTDLFELRQHSVLYLVCISLV